MADANYIFLLSLTIILIGFLLKKVGVFSESNGKVIAKFILNITLPALILNVFSNIIINPTLILLPFLALGYSLIVLSFTYLFSRNYTYTRKGLILMMCVGFNIGLFAYPMIKSIWGVEGFEYVVMFDLGNGFVVFIYSYIMGFVHSPKIKPVSDKLNGKNILKNIFKSVPLLTLIVALSINLSGFRFPIFITDILDLLSRANSPLTLLILGIFININFDKSHWKLIITVLIIRYGFGLSIGILLMVFLPFGTTINAAIFVALILPIGMAIIPFSVEFGYNEQVTSTTVNLTNIISFFIMWIIVLLIGIG